MPFYNPYNFIPTPTRKADDELGDHRPVGHQTYWPDKWSGRLDVAMTVETPLLVPGLPRDETKAHKVYRTRLGSDKLPYLPPTSIKGMLRSAYEAITNSRMGILQKHDERLAFRMKAAEGLGLVPAIVYSDRIELMMGSTPGLPIKNYVGQWHLNGHPLYAAWLPRYKPTPAHTPLEYVEGGVPRHGEDAHAVLERVHHQNPPYDLWRVRLITRDPARIPAADPAPTSAAAKYAPCDPPVFIRPSGIVVITNENTPNKHDERFFFLEPSRTPVTIPLTPAEFQSFQSAWRDLIHSYQNAHRKRDVWEREHNGRRVPPDEFIPRIPATPHAPASRAIPAFSPHIYQDGDPRRDNHAPQDDASVLVDGTLCYASVTTIAAGGVKALYPVPIARELYNQPPINLIDPETRPAPSLNDLSPADRVFGWVRQRTTEKDKNQPAAYRGQLRVSQARCTPPSDGQPLDTFERPLALAILSGPKPQQARFYLAEDVNGRPLDAAGSKAYLATQRIRGRKVYPHQRVPDPTTYWSKTPPPDAEHVRTATPTETSQNRSIESWVRPGTAFNFSIDIVNLSNVELGALIWLLSLGDQHFHRFGGGKPLGFGSVRVVLSGANLSDGAFRKACYRKLVGRPQPQSQSLVVDGSKAISSASDPLVGELAASFEKRTEDVYGAPFDRVPFIKAFRKAARGYKPANPTHYPRPAAGGDNFEWFLHATPLKRIDDDTDPYFA